MDGWKAQNDKIQPLTKGFIIQKSRVSSNRGAIYFGPGHSDIPHEKRDFLVICREVT